MDRGAWGAADHRVTKNQTRLKQLSITVVLVCLIGVTNNWQVQTLPGITYVT